MKENLEFTGEFLKSTEVIIKTYRGWHELEKSSGIDIIDFDLIPAIEGEKFRSRDEVLEKLRFLHDQIEPKNSQEEFIKAKINSSTYYLRALMGEKIPYREYVENIIGIAPQEIPENEISVQKEIMNDLLREVGYKPSKESFYQFSQRIRLTSKKQARIQADECERTLIPIVLEELGFQHIKFPHKIRFVEERNYWMGWTSTTQEGLLLRYNFHPLREWYLGDMEFMTLHEVGGHFVQAAILKKRIEYGEVNPLIGVTTVHEPHTFIGEGTANAISYFLPEVDKALSPYGLLARAQRTVRDYVQNNAHIWINEGRSEDELVEYIMEHHPFSSEENIRMNLNNWKNNPLRRAYQYVYGISQYYHHQFYQKLNQEKQKIYLKHAMSRYETPNQIIQFVDHLARQ